MVVIEGWVGAVVIETYDFVSDRTNQMCLG